jgi:serine/threonine protein kinase
VTAKNPYWIVGNQEGRAYVERDADIKLRRDLTDNQRYLFLHGPRSCGKSSLIVHCMDSLSPGQYCCTRVDVSRLPLTDYATFIGRLLETVAQDTALDKQVIRTDAPEDTILAWLGTFPQRLVLFLDEVQALARAPFKDQLFGKLRFLYNVRVENTLYSRLQVVLAGAVHPDQLMPAALATPFAGGAIAVPNLSPKQVEKLSWDLETAEVPVDGQVSHSLYQQTGGNVHLCQLVLHGLWADASQSRTAIGIADLERVIDRLVNSADKTPHFATLYQAMKEDLPRLEAFQQFILGTTPDSKTLHDLCSLGISDPDNPFACPIYERVFGPGGSLDLRKLQQQLQAASAVASAEPTPSQRTPEVHIEPPSEARREHSLLLRLADASRVTPQRDVSPYALVSPEAEALPEPPSALIGLPEPPRPAPVSLSGSVEALPALIDMQAESSADFLGLPIGAAPVVPTLSLGSSEPSTKPAAEPSPTASAQSSEVVVQIDQSQEEESTWVEDPVKEMTNQLAAVRAEKARASSELGKDARKLVELRQALENKLMLSAELDSFCSSFFPHVAEKFALGMSRPEKTELLLANVASHEISKRLREWSSRLDVRQDLVGVVAAAKSASATSGSTKPTDDATTPAAAPPVAEPPPAYAAPLGAPIAADPQLAAVAAGEEPANFKPPMNTLQVGVGLVLANRYFLTNELARGPVAVVWSAYDRIKDEQVALKLVHGAAAEKPPILEVFWRSAHQMAALSHPAIVGVLNKPREENEIHYVVMECLSGGNLRQWVHGGKLSRVHIMRVLQRLGAGLQYAHERRVLHRNIKPTNILFDSTGHARLTDFGMVWPVEAVSDSETRSDRLMYSAPEEQLPGSSGDARSDVYSLGMCALFAVYGQELPGRAVQDRAAFIDQLDATPALKTVLRRATSVSPAERFASAAEFCRALDFDAPMLPGVSPRNSLPPEGQRYSERSGAIQALPSNNSGGWRAPSPPATPASPPPPIPDSAARTPGPASVAVDNQGPLPQLAMPPLLFSDAQPARAAAAASREPAPPPRPVMPPPTLPVELDPMRGLAAPPVLAMPPVEPIAPPPPAGRWQLFAMAGLALLAVGGAGLGYWWGGQRSNPQAGLPNVADGRGASGSQPAVAVSRPLRVESLLPPPDPATRPVAEPPQNPPPADVAAAPMPTAPEPAKVAAAAPPASGKQAAAAKSLSGIQVAAAPGVPPAKALPTAAAPGKKPLPVPTAAPAQVAMAKPVPAVAPASATPPVPTQAPVAKAAQTNPAVAQAPAAKVAPMAKPVAPAKAATPPAAKPTLLASAQAPRVTAPKPAPRPAAPIVARPQPTPIARVTPPPAAPRPAPASSEGGGASSEAALQAAQQAFVRGQHHQAISLAMQVTGRGGPDAIKAWRFVGGAACSSGQGQLATSAYNHLRDPDHRRMLIELCRRNGLNYNGSQFGPED